MTDLEKIQRLTYVSVALLCCQMGVDPTIGQEALRKAGCKNAKNFLYPFGTIHVSLGRIMHWAEQEGLLPGEKNK